MKSPNQIFPDTSHNASSTHRSLEKHQNGGLTPDTTLRQAQDSLAVDAVSLVKRHQS